MCLEVPHCWFWSFLGFVDNNNKYKILPDLSFKVFNGAILISFTLLGGQCRPQVPAPVCQGGVQPNEKKDGEAGPGKG